MEMWKESQLRQISNARNIESAYEMSLSLVQGLGFKFCAFSITPLPRGPRYETVNLNNYPNDWNAAYDQNHFREIDPILAHCSHSPLPILWDEKLYSKTPLMWNAQKKQGLEYGLSQPLHDDKGLHSVLSVAGSSHPITPYELYENLGYVLFVCHHLHGLVAQKLPNRVPQSCEPHLTAREIEVLRLSADGKTAYEISRILRLSERTVNFHVCSCIKKFNVNNKIAAVIAAARACMI